MESSSHPWAWPAYRQVISCPTFTLCSRTSHLVGHLPHRPALPPCRSKPSYRGHGLRISHRWQSQDGRSSPRAWQSLPPAPHSSPHSGHCLQTGWRSSWASHKDLPGEEMGRRRTWVMQLLMGREALGWHRRMSPTLVNFGGSLSSPSIYFLRLCSPITKLLGLRKQTIKKRISHHWDVVHFPVMVQEFWYFWSYLWGHCVGDMDPKWSLGFSRSIIENQSSFTYIRSRCWALGDFFWKGLLLWEGGVWQPPQFSLTLMFYTWGSNGSKEASDLSKSPKWNLGRARVKKVPLTSRKLLFSHPLFLPMAEFWHKWLAFTPGKTFV